MTPFLVEKEVRYGIFGIYNDLCDFTESDMAG